MSDIRAVLRKWWHDPVHYRWLVHTLESHSALRPIKFVVGAGGFVMLAITLLTWRSPAGPAGVVGHLIFAAVAVTAALWMARWWLFPWPRQIASLAWLAWADLVITAGCLVDRDSLQGALAAMLLAVTGAYLMLFHSPKILAIHAVWSLLTALALAGLLVSRGTSVLQASAIVLIMAAVVAVVLPAMQFCYWVLRTDVLSDPLTKLWNRRGLDYYLYRPRQQRLLCVMAIDLDRFKVINDTYGHPVGDEVLVRTAEWLRATVDCDSVVARTGGEEFMVVGELEREAALVTAERLRHAVETMPDMQSPITASVGVAISDGGERTGRPEKLIRCADTAMYQAKQLGGNAVVLAVDPSNTPTEMARISDVRTGISVPHRRA